MTQCVKKEEKPAFITVMHGLIGYFAVLVSWNEDLDGFYEPYQTGPGRYRDAKEAAKEARAWARDEGLEFRPNAR